MEQYDDEDEDEVDVFAGTGFEAWANIRRGITFDSSGSTQRQNRMPRAETRQQ